MRASLFISPFFRVLVFLETFVVGEIKLITCGKADLHRYLQNILVNDFFLKFPWSERILEAQFIINRDQPSVNWITVVINEQR